MVGKSIYNLKLHQNVIKNNWWKIISQSVAGNCKAKAHPTEFCRQQWIKGKFCFHIDSSKEQLVYLTTSNNDYKFYKIMFQLYNCI